MSCAQFAIESNQTMTEIMDELFSLCDALPSVGPSQAVVDCDKITDMPDISFSLPDADLTLSAEQYVLRVRVSLQTCRRQVALFTSPLRWLLRFLWFF